MSRRTLFVVGPNDDVVATVLELVRRYGLIPDDRALVAELWPGECPKDLQDRIQVLVEAGLVRRVWLGNEPHLALGGRSDLGPRSSDLEYPSLMAPTDAFSIDLEVDALSERLLFYRLAIVFEVLMGLFGLREVVMWAIGP